MLSFSCTLILLSKEEVGAMVGDSRAHEVPREVDMEVEVAEVVVVDA